MCRSMAIRMAITSPNTTRNCMKLCMQPSPPWEQCDWTCFILWQLTFPGLSYHILFYFLHTTGIPSFKSNESILHFFHIPTLEIKIRFFNILLGESFFEPMLMAENFISWKCTSGVQKAITHGFLWARKEQVANSYFLWMRLTECSAV